MGCIIKIGNQSVSETDFLNHLNKIISVNTLFEENSDFSSQIYKALGFKILPKKGTKEYRDVEDILELEMMLEELGNEKLRGNFKFQDILLKADKTKGFTDKYVGWRKYFNVVTDMDTMIGIYGYVNEKEGYTQSEDTLQQLLQLIKNHVNEFKIEDITPQQKQQAQQLYSQYLEQNPNGSVEQFKNWVDEFNRKTNLEVTSENKTIEELYKENPKLKKFINSVTDEDDNTLSLSKVKNLLNQKGEGRIVKLNNILYNAIERLWDNKIFSNNNIKIHFVDSLPEEAIGHFNRDNNEITIDKTKFLNIVNGSYKGEEIFYLGYILNHEIIHYLTPEDLSLKIEYVDRALNGRFGDTFKFKHEREFGKNIKELYDIAITNLEDVTDYGFLNLAEFVTEAMSNTNFQEKLASIPYKSTKKSLWKRFIEIVSAYLTKYTGKPINDTLLEAVLAEITNYITENSNIQKTYKRRNIGKNGYIDLNYDFVFNTAKNVKSLSNFISQKSQERLNQIQDIFNEYPDFSSQIYEALGFNQIITPNDKIVFGHPGLGKTYLKESGRTDIIDFDSDYKTKINEKFNLPKGFKARNDFQKSNKEEYQKAVRELWIEAKQEVKKTGKQLFASDMILLREFASDFDKVITMSKDTFINRAKQRNDYTSGETESWKNSLDIEISKLDKSKVFNTDKYLSDLFITPQQKQQATFMFSEFLDVYLQDFEQVEKILKEENIIEKDCSGGGKLKAEKGLQTNFTKGGKWEIYEIFEGKSHKQGGIDINIKNNQISFTNKSGSIKAKYGLVISKENKL